MSTTTMASSQHSFKAEEAYPPPTLAAVDSYTLPKRPWRLHVTPFERILAHRYKGAGTAEDPYIVDWIAHDAEDPQGWPAPYKWFQVAVCSILTLAVTLTSSAYSGGIKELIMEFGGDPTLWTGGVSLFVLGFAFGPLLWAPCSEVWGRRPVYNISTVGLTLWTCVTCAAPNPGAILVFRALAGFFGSSPLTNAGGTVADILNAQQRGIGMALFAAAPFLGPALGPISGGFIGDAAGWRWVMGFLGLFCGVMMLLMGLCCPETYHPKLLRDRAATLSKATGKVYRYHGDAQKPLNVKQLFHVAVIRPWQLLTEPIVLALSIYIAIVYGTLYLNFAAYPIVFQRGRGWSAGQNGLAFLGIAAGAMLAITLTLLFVNKQYAKAAAPGEALPPPEARLPSAIYGGIAIVIGLAGFAATDGPRTHWIAPILFGIPFGFGMVIVFLATMGYLVDAYTIYAASVLAANAVLRSLFGAAFPLFTTKMYNRLGVHWAAAVPGFLALACVPFPVLFYKYGARIRARCKYARDAEATMRALMARRAAQETEGKDEEAAAESVPGASAAESVPSPLGRVLSTASVRDPAHPLHREFSVYTVLADRDEVDLSDDERLRLETLKAQMRPYRRTE